MRIRPVENDKVLEAKKTLDGSQIRSKFGIIDRICWLNGFFHIPSGLRDSRRDNCFRCMVFLKDSEEFVEEKQDQPSDCVDNVQGDDKNEKWILKN